MTPTDIRARELLGSCEPAALANMLATSEAALRGVSGLFRTEPFEDDPPLISEIRNVRKAIALIERASGGG
jgi:hypothetical protein